MSEERQVLNKQNLGIEPGRRALRQFILSLLQKLFDRLGQLSVLWNYLVL